MSIDNIAPDVDIEAELAKQDVAPAPAADATPPADAPAPTEQEHEPVAQTEQQTDDAAPAEPADPKKPPPGFVNYGALKEAREQIKAAREAEARLKAEYEARMSEMQKRIDAIANPPAPVPKFEDNPAENLRHEVATTKAQLEAQAKELEARKQADQIAALENRITRDVEANEAEFAKVQPDYYDAAKHFQAVADRNLQALGVDDPAQRAQMIRRDVMQLAARALGAGKNPAEVVYALAQNQGYAAKPAEKSAPVDKVANIKKGQQATPSMPSGAASHRDALESLANMDDDQIDELTKDPEKWSKLIRTA